MWDNDPPCKTDDQFLASLPGAFEKDKLGLQCSHCDNDRGTPEDNPHYMCKGVYELLTDGSCDPRYGPRMCETCKDSHHNCMRVKCNKCGDITRRFAWMQQMHYQMHVENPRRIVKFSVE